MVGRLLYLLRARTFQAAKKKNHKLSRQPSGCGLCGLLSHEGKKSLRLVSHSRKVADDALDCPQFLLFPWGHQNLELPASPPSLPSESFTNRFHDCIFTTFTLSLSSNSVVTVALSRKSSKLTAYLSGCWKPSIFSENRTLLLRQGCQQSGKTPSW